MDYFEWADEYYDNALRIKTVLEKKKKLLNEKGLSADRRKQLSDEIREYRAIYRELRQTGDFIRDRAGEATREA